MNKRTENVWLPSYSIIALFGVVVISGIVSKSAFAQAYSPTSASVHYVNTTGNGLETDPVYAAYNYPLINGTNSGFVGLSGANMSGIPTISTGAYASSADGGWVQTETRYTTSVYVDSGTSGLANGTAVTLQLALQLDGNVSVTSGEDAAYSNMSFNFQIAAPDQAVFDPGKGWYVPTIANFSTNVDSSVDNFFTDFYGDPGGAWYHSTEYSAGWEWNSNLASGNGGEVNYYNVEAGLVSTSDSNIFDTGMVLIDFETFVGDTLNILSFFDVWGDTYGLGSSATVDFLNTMQATLTSQNGLNFVYGGAQVVPVPAAVWLFASAFIGLLGLSRRA